MNHCIENKCVGEDPAVVSIVLPKPVAQQLLALLHQRLGCGSCSKAGATHEHALETAEEELDDALAIAVWLGENVKLSWPATEVTEVLSVLGEAASEGDGRLPEEASSALALARDRLSAGVGRVKPR